MPTPSGRPQLIEIPGAELAITVHNGAISDLDQTYGALGTFVAEQEIGVDGPIREHYVVSSDEAGAEPAHHTEVCWPVFRTKERLPSEGCEPLHGELDVAVATLEQLEGHADSPFVRF